MLNTRGSLWINRKESKDKLKLTGTVDAAIMADAVSAAARGEQIRVLVFVNERKEKDNHPDFRLVVATDSDEDDMDRARSDGRKKKTRKRKSRDDDDDFEASDSDVPF
jgi:hypothetical protein